MIPDFGGLIWMIIALIEVVVFGCLFALFYFWVMPAISRWFIKIKWSKGSVAFIQHGSIVKVYNSNIDLPEGVLKFNKQGWFLKSMHPHLPEAKRGPGRPTKDALPPKEQVNEGLDVLLRTPLLDGLNRPVFFGSADVALLANLETLSEFSPNENRTKTGIRHSILNVLKEIIPFTMSRSQLDALGTTMYIKGRKAAGGDQTKIIIVAIAVIGVIVAAGLVFGFLTGSFGGSGGA